MGINFDLIRRVCLIPNATSNQVIEMKAAEFTNSQHNKCPELFKRLLSGEVNQSIRARYGVNCYCTDGEYRPYGSTLKPGHVYAMLMSPQECTHCRTITIVFSNFIQGLSPSSSGGLVGENVKALDRLIKREERKRNKDKKTDLDKIASGENND